MPFISNQKKPACASKRNVLELAILRFINCKWSKLNMKFWLSIKLWIGNFKCSLLSEAHPSVFTSHDVRFNIASTSPQQL